MKKILASIFLAATFSLHATAPPRGDERLRELVVFPEISLNFGWNISCENNEYVIYQSLDLPEAIAEQREKLKRQPDDVKQLMRLAYLLNSNDETNESQVFYQKAEQLCRDKVAANPRDGLSLIELGKALDAIRKEAEAESVFRKATLVSSNEWRCWVNLGVFLGNESFDSIFPKNMSNMFAAFFAPGQMPSQAVLDYRPAPELLQKSESLCKEASQCFDRALAIASNNPGIFLQRAGFMSSSNVQSRYVRYYRDGEKFDKVEWLTAFFAPAMIADLKRASELKPKDYQCLSFAAYSEFMIPMISSIKQGNTNSFTLDMLPDKTQKSIRAALTRLENLSEDVDKKIAAGALENLGILNMFLGNKPEATVNFQRAVRLDPAREQTWDLLMGMLLDSVSPDELLAAAKSRLKTRDSAHNHIILSKVFAQRMDKWKEAAAQAQIAFQQETNNVLPPLMLTAIALKQSSQTNYLSMAQTNIVFANAILHEMPESDEKNKRLREIMSNAAIFCALTGQIEWAKNYANEILKHFPDDETAKEILQALN